MNGEQNLRLIREIEANREFLLMAYRQNPALLARAEPRIHALFAPSATEGDARPDDGRMAERPTTP